MVQSSTNILITRPLHEALLLKQALIQEGYKVLLDPILNIKFYSMPSIDLSNTQAIIVTSINGLKKIDQIFVEKDLPIYVVGSVSAREAEKKGFKQIFAANGSVSSLARLILENLNPKNGKIIYLSGNEIKGSLIEELTSKNYNIIRIIVYEAIASQFLSNITQNVILKNELQAILFFSPRTAQIFLQHAQPYYLYFKNIVTICMSLEISLTLQKYKWRDILISAERSEQSMIKVLNDYFK